MKTAMFPNIPDLSAAKWAFTTRRVNRAHVMGLQPQLDSAVAGDVVLGEISSIGQHKKIQLAEGRYALSYPGDTVVMVCGDRYAPDQFEGAAKLDLAGCDVLAGGGLLGRMEAGHGRMSAPTRIRPIGLLTDADGAVMNVASYAVPKARIPAHVTVLGVFGASMNAGKTTAAVSLAHGLKKAGFRVEGVKATGTGAFGDFNAFLDAGIAASDFTDAGMASTYRMPMSRIEQGFETLVGAAAKRGADIVVVEFADGVFQQETADILKGGPIKDRLNGVLFAAPDALGAVGGISVMARYGMAPFAVSGMVTRSPLAVREVEAATGITMLSRDELTDPAFVVPALGAIMSQPDEATEIAA